LFKPFGQNSPLEKRVKTESEICSSVSDSFQQSSGNDLEYKKDKLESVKGALDKNYDIFQNKYA